MPVFMWGGGSYNPRAYLHGRGTNGYIRCYFSVGYNRCNFTLTLLGEYEPTHSDDIRESYETLTLTLLNCIFYKNIITLEYYVLNISYLNNPIRRIVSWTQLPIISQAWLYIIKWFKVDPVFVQGGSNYTGIQFISSAFFF